MAEDKGKPGRVERPSARSDGRLQRAAAADAGYVSELVGSFDLELREDVLNRERIALECDHHPGTMDGPPLPMTPQRAERLEQLNAAIDRLQGGEG